MSITGQASEPLMEEILSSLRTVTSSNEMGNKPAIAASGREKAAAPKPEPRFQPKPNAEPMLQPKPEPQPMARPQGDSEPDLVKKVAASEGAKETGRDDHFDLTEAIEAIQNNNQFRRLIARTDRKMVAGLASAWKSLRAARKQIGSGQSEVDAAKLALEGVRREGQAGSRTSLDVLDAEKKYLDAQVALIGARRDEVVASYELLASVGRLTTEFLRLPVGSSDPAIHYDSTRGKETRSGFETGKSD